MNPYESPRAVDADMRKQIALAVAQDGTLVGMYRALAGTAIALWSIFALAVIGTRDLVPRMLDDFDTDLPAMTQFFVSSTFAFAVAFLCLATIAKERLLKSKALCAMWNAAAILLVLILAGLYSAALVLPVIQIGERLG